jgi:hypothetical protein
VFAVDFALTYVNDGPRVDVSGVHAVFTEGQIPAYLPLGSNITCSEPEGEEISGGSIEIDTSDADDELYLIGSADAAITATVTKTKITFSGTASVEAYQRVLRLVYFRNSNNQQPVDGTRTVTVKLTDVPAAGYGLSAVTTTATVNLTVFLASQYPYAAPTITAATKPSTSGGAITLTGTNFGPARTLSSLAALQNEGTSITVEVPSTLDVTGLGYPINVISDTTLVYGGVTPGVGLLSITLVIGGQSVTFTDGDAYGYAPPTITTFNSPSYVLCQSGSIISDRNGRGTNVLTITGTSFGPAGTNPVLVVGASSTDNKASNDVTAATDLFPQTCTVTVAHTTATCRLSCTAQKVVAIGKRDVKLTANGISGFSFGADDGGFSLQGPTVTSVDGQGSPASPYQGVSMFGGSYGGPVTITGRGFGGSVTPTGFPNDGTTLASVKVCFEETYADCSGADWKTVTGASRGAGTASDTTIVITEMPAGDPDTDFHIQVTVSDGTTSIDSGETGAGKLRYEGPQIQTNAEGFAVVPGTTTLIRPSTAGSAMSFGQVAPFTNFGPNVTLNEASGDKLLWSQTSSVDFVDLMRIFVAPYYQTNASIGANSSTLTFTAPPGAGQVEFSFGRQCGNMDDFANGCYGGTARVKVKYAAPTVVGTSYTAPTEGAPGVIITGSNFGSLDTPVEVMFYTSEMGGTASFSATNARVTTAHTEITADIPPGVGRNFFIGVTAAGISAETPRTGQFSYIAPAVNAVTTTNTTGGIITVTGSGFGPLDSAPSVTIDGVVCGTPAVTVASTELTCTVGAGTGRDYSVIVIVGGKASPPGPAATFSYLPPAISTATSVSFIGGDLITIRGYNFGYSSGLSPLLPRVGATPIPVLVSIGGVAATGCTVLADSRVRCRAPSFLYRNPIVNLTLGITVRGQDNSAQSAPVPMYSFNGPVITAISPVSVFGGFVTVTGQNFGSDPAALQDITLNGAALDLTRAQPAIVTNNTAIRLYLSRDPLTGVAGIGEANRLEIFFGAEGTNTTTGPAALLDFTGPVINTTSRPWSSGRLSGSVNRLTVFGQNFGPVGSAYILKPLTVDQTECETECSTSR